MATSKSKGSAAAADSTATTGAADGALATQTDTGVSDVQSSGLAPDGSGALSPDGAGNGAGATDADPSKSDETGSAATEVDLAASASVDPLAASGDDAVQTAATPDASLGDDASGEPGALTELARAVVIYFTGTYPIGSILEGRSDAIQRLASSGDLDPHPAAVAAAEAAGATVHRLEG